MGKARLTAFFGILAFSASAHSALINGAGATFPYPLYSKWISEFTAKNTDVRLNYQSMGSGTGISKLIDQTIDFGASDAPMTEEQLKSAPREVIHVPTVLGAVALTFNVPGVRELKLSPDVLAAIYLGNITKWSDAKLKELNPDLKLPSTPIILINRSDGSGTTAIFTDYLQKVSPEFKKKVGYGTSVRWPVGLGARGNEGVTSFVKKTQGAIGYVEFIYAKSNGLAVASIKNSSGVFVNPSVESVSAAADGVKIPEDFRVSLTNPESQKAYPISGFTYLLVYKSMSKEKGEPLLKFIQWALSEGQTMASALNYAPLPKSLLPRVKAKVDEINLN
ncbi:MAG: phosphate ABC transporter substrate-binding protein PstS [Bdellovibrionales bacterium CG10_big_fil_rev_8_21_14_0_10_45_34]|nr:MAG: phosphate ABC transporter substrate-binding protein PstS [Bdellovibrionales bacterium CG10_big_fil_rev_8_21_14_0_10_45_34]